MSLETLKPNLEQKKTKEQKLPIPSKEALEAIRKAQEAKKIPVIASEPSITHEEMIEKLNEEPETGLTPPNQVEDDEDKKAKEEFNRKLDAED